MKISRMSELNGAGKYGSCSECTKNISSDDEALKITFECGSSIMLCRKCWTKLNVKLSRIEIKQMYKIMEEERNA